jgi:hypothetical protein
MHYLDGQIAKMGDEVSLTGATGKIVYSIDNGEYSDLYKEEQRAALQNGVLIKFDAFGRREPI